jgi:hypothetical protein
MYTCISTPPLKFTTIQLYVCPIIFVILFFFFFFVFWRACSTDFHYLTSDSDSTPKITPIITLWSCFSFFPIQFNWFCFCCQLHFWHAQPTAQLDRSWFLVSDPLPIVWYNKYIKYYKNILLNTIHTEYEILIIVSLPYEFLLFSFCFLYVFHSFSFDSYYSHWVYHWYPSRIQHNHNHHYHSHHDWSLSLSYFVCNFCCFSTSFLSSLSSPTHLLFLVTIATSSPYMVVSNWILSLFHENHHHLIV